MKARRACRGKEVRRDRLDRRNDTPGNGSDRGYSGILGLAQHIAGPAVRAVVLRALFGHLLVIVRVTVAVPSMCVTVMSVTVVFVTVIFVTVIVMIVVRVQMVVASTL